MRAALSCAIAALLASAVPARAQATLPLDRARMYPLPARQAWQAALDTLAALGLKTDQRDAGHQYLITKFRSYGDKTVAGPDNPGYAPLRFQLHVFVSPFAEPARVHVSSVSELRGPGGGLFILYRERNAEKWFLDALDGHLGTPGRAIPIDAGARERQAAELGYRPCQPREDDSKLLPPTKIKASQVEVIYPAPAATAGRQATVVVVFQVGEDGATYGVRLREDGAADEQFQSSALGAASLIRYVPLRLGGCPAPSLMTYTVAYRSRR